MGDWISADIKPEGTCAAEKNELEIAFWDGCYMCRIFGVYDLEMEAWYSCQEPIEEDGFVVTHWRYPVALPEPPVKE